MLQPHAFNSNRNRNYTSFVNFLCFDTYGRNGFTENNLFTVTVTGTVGWSWGSGFFRALLQAALIAASRLWKALIGTGKFYSDHHFNMCQLFHIIAIVLALTELCGSTAFSANLHHKFQKI